MPHVQDPTLPPARPETLGGYRVVGIIGSGSLGTVYLAAGSDGASVAIKTLSLATDDPERVSALFEREALVSQRLQHPDIVRTLASGYERDLAYLVMEHVPGGTLASLIAARRPGRLDETLRVMERIARALGHAHEMGIVHRDVKPANVLVDRMADLVKVADFGLARMGDMFRSRTGVMAGTPAYMSPEQLVDGAVDARADLYALGVMLFEWLSGRRPFGADSLGTLLRQVGTEPAPDLLVLRPELPAGLAQLVAELLDKRPQCRPRTAQVVADRLRALRLGLPASA